MAFMDAHLLKLAVACVDVAMAAVAWLILLCTYPDFARWRAAGFAEAHEAYTRRVGWVVGPLLLAQLAGHVLTWFRSGDLLGLALVAAAWLLTGSWSVTAVSKAKARHRRRSEACSVRMPGGPPFGRPWRRIRSGWPRVDSRGACLDA
jgi:hypothetical protein